MGLTFFLLLLGAAAAAAASSRSSTPSSTPSSSSRPPETGSAWSRRRGAAPTSTTSPRTDASIEAMSPESAAAAVAQAVHSRAGRPSAEALARRWLTPSSRTGVDVGRFVRALQQRDENGMAEWSLDHWRMPASSSSSSRPDPMGYHGREAPDGTAGVTAAAHALALIRSGASDGALAYLDQWVSEPARTTLDISRAARDLQTGGQDELADHVLDAWNDRAVAHA